MENNRRLFFKGLATFISGVAAAKAASYIPKKEEPKEDVLVTSTITIKHEGEDYHPLVVKKTDKDKNILISTNTDSGFELGSVRFPEYKQTLRKLNNES